VTRVLEWYVRDNANVRKAFAKLWGTDDLLVSFDGMPIWRPWSHPQLTHTKTSPGGHRDGSTWPISGLRPSPPTPYPLCMTGWLHVDQHPVARPGLHCVQGLVNLLPMGPHTGGNVLIPDSHKDHSHIPAKYPQRLAKMEREMGPGVDHFRYPPGDALLENPVMCHLEPGDLLLWDSRTIHCSACARQGESPPAPDQLLRAASLVCMMPKSKTPAQVLEQRKAAVSGIMSTTNWTDQCVDTGQYPGMLKIPKEVAAKYTLPPNPMTYLNRNQLRLVGYTDTEIDQAQRK